MKKSLQLSGTRLALLAAGIVAIGGAFALSALFAHASSGPVITTTVTNPANVLVAAAPIGTSLVAGATVSSSTAATVPTGTVTFNTYANQNCSGTPTVQSGVALVNGMASSSATVMGANGLSYIINYSGDATNTPSVNSCIYVSPLSSAVTLATGLSSNSVLSGSSVTASATLAGVTSAATGTVAYNFYTNNTCTLATTSPASVTVASGIVPTSAPVTFTVPGTYYLQAAYSGDMSNASATSTCGSSVLTVSAPSSTPATGTIKVDEITSPAASSTSFQFNTTGTGYGSFSLTDTAAPNQQTLIPGAYTVTQTTVPGWTLTSAACSRDGATAAAYTPGATITLAAGDTVSCVFTDTAVTATTTPTPTPTPAGTGSISGTVFNDLNGNKVLDSGEAGIAGITVKLTSTHKNKWWFMPATTVMTTTVTDANGNYSFSNLQPGTYVVQQIKSDSWKQETSDFKGITLGATALTNVNFADRAASSSINGKHDKDDQDDQDDNNDDNDNEQQVSSSTVIVNIHANFHSMLKGENGKHKGEDKNDNNDKEGNDD